jgi:hypothetical protein
MPLNFPEDDHEAGERKERVVDRERAAVAHHQAAEDYEPALKRLAESVL